MKEVEIRDRGRDNIFYYHKASDHSFGQIVAGVGFPGRLPGHVCVFGQNKNEDRGIRMHHVHLLAEAEDLAAGELLRKLADLEDRYEVQDVFGFLDEQDLFYLSSWNDAADRRSRDSLYIQPPPYAEDDRLEYFIRVLQDRLRAGSKSLHLGEGSKLAQHLLQLQPEEVITMRTKDFPASPPPAMRWPPWASGARATARACRNGLSALGTRWRIESRRIGIKAEWDPRAGRRWDCAHYGECLEAPAREDLPEIPGCPCGRFRPGAIPSLEVEAAYTLLLAVFWPKVWRRGEGEGITS